MDIYVTLEEVYNGNFIEVGLLDRLHSRLYQCLGRSSQTSSQANVRLKEMQLPHGDANHSDGTGTGKRVDSSSGLFHWSLVG